MVEKSKKCCTNSLKSLTTGETIRLLRFDLQHHKEFTIWIMAILVELNKLLRARYPNLGIKVADFKQKHAFTATLILGVND